MRVSVGGAMWAGPDEDDDAGVCDGAGGGGRNGCTTGRSTKGEAARSEEGIGGRLTKTRAFGSSGGGGGGGSDEEEAPRTIR